MLSNLPSGCSVHDLPGCRREDEEHEVVLTFTTRDLEVLYNAAHIYENDVTTDDEMIKHFRLIEDTLEFMIEQLVDERKVLEAAGILEAQPAPPVESVYAQWAWLLDE